MIDDVSSIESLIKQRLTAVTVFQNATAEAEVEIDIQNVPGRDLNLVRLLLSHENAAALSRDAALADRLIATIEQALEGPSEEPEALLDLRGQL